MGTGFTREPKDALQVAGDMALEAIRVKLGLAGIGVDDFSVVITLSHGDDLATVLHLPGEGNDAEEAFNTQLLHLAATAKEIGVRVAVVPAG